MHFMKAAAWAVTVWSLFVTAGCGGGSEPLANPSSPPQDLAAKANTLVVNMGTATLPADNYPINTVNQDASGVIRLKDGQMIEFVFPENGHFEATFAFSQSEPDKFLIGLMDQFDNDTHYSCVSRAWSDAELTDLALAIHDPDLTSAPKCPANVTIDVANHRISFHRIQIPSDNDSAKSITISSNFSWSVQASPDAITRPFDG